MELRGHSPQFHIHVSVSDLYIPSIGPHIFCNQNRQIDPGNIYKSWIVDIGTEAAQFPEKEYINDIFVAVWYTEENETE
jgi:hypothetical protein